MTKKLHATGQRLPVIRDTNTPLPRIDGAQIQAALGAEPRNSRTRDVRVPISLLALREQLVERLQSTGGRPALSGVTLRAKIPLRESDWSTLEELAQKVASPGLVPSAGQVASILLTLAVQSVKTQLAKESTQSGESPTLKELAALAVEGSSDHSSLADPSSHKNS